LCILRKKDHCAADSRLVFKLTVTEGKGDSDSDDVSVGVAKVQNVFPKAHAEDNQQAEVNTEAKLDGSKNSEEDGEIVSYKWEQTDGPEADLKHSDE
jgi:large repetitive protein